MQLIKEISTCGGWSFRTAKTHKRHWRHYRRLAKSLVCAAGPYGAQPLCVIRGGDKKEWNRLPQFGNDGEPDRGEAGDRLHRQARRRGLVRHLQGAACRVDPRRRGPKERRRQALRALLQARSDGAARGAELWKFSLAAGKQR